MALKPKSYCGFLDNWTDRLEKALPILLASSLGLWNLRPYNIIYNITSESGIETVIILNSDLMF